MKILIADDELIIRQWLSLTIGKIGDGFEVAGEVSNGAEALEFCRKTHIDLVIIDIKMPVMDGIELMKVLKKEMSYIHFLILSSYNEFKFAMDAVKFGASDYILKAEVTPEHLTEALNKIKKAIELENSRKYELGQLKSFLDENSYSLRAIYLNELIRGNDHAIREFESKASILNIALDKRKLNLMVLSIDNYKNEITNKSDIRFVNNAVISIVDDIISSEAGNGCSFLFSENTFVILFNFQTNSIKSFREFVLVLANKISTALKKILYIDISVGISIAYGEITMLKKQMQEALSALNQKIFYGSGSVVFFEDINTIRLKAENKDLNYLLKELSDYIDAGELQSSVKCVQNFLIDVGNRRHMLSDQVGKLCLEIVYLLISKMRKLNIEEQYIFNLFADPLSDINQLSTFKGLEEWLNDKLSHCTRIMSLKLKQHFYSEPVKKAWDYMVKNYDKDITLNMISDYVNLNHSYFCELFKKETGHNFNSMLTGIRVEKAKELLKMSGVKINELGESVGIFNPSYFSRVFKKYTGTTPLEYKEQYKKSIKKTE